MAAQTDSTPLIPACAGYRMEEGKKYIAISRDLMNFSTPEIDALECGDKVRICCNECPYEGEYIVVDKMNKRFTSYVDIFSNPSLPYGKWNGTIEKFYEEYNYY